jgi:hypothetical protein
MARKCVFCGRQPVTREHVFPEWLLELLRPEGEPVAGEQAIWDIGPDDEPHLREHRPKIQETVVRRACGPCNSGWMEADEKLIRRLVLGQLTSLDRDQQRRVASWAMKTTIMFDFTHSGQRVIGSEHHRWLYEKREPPPNTAVWIMRNEPSREWLLNVSHNTMRLLATRDPNIDPTARHYLHSTGLGMGKVFMLIVGTDFPGLDVVQAAQLPPYRLVWPASERPVIFPYGYELTNEQAILLTLTDYKIAFQYLGATGPFGDISAP